MIDKEKAIIDAFFHETDMLIKAVNRTLPRMMASFLEEDSKNWQQKAHDTQRRTNDR